MMKLPFFLSIFILLLYLASCSNNNKTQPDGNTQVESFIEETDKLPESTAVSKQLFAVESAYIKFLSKAAGQEITREWRFDQYGGRQYEENYMLVMGQKMGDKTIVVDGFQYKWNFDSNEGRKSKFYQTATDYDKISEKDIERYGIAKHGYEEVLGKKCLKVTIERPAKSTIWLWNGIALKTEAVFGGNEVHMVAVEIAEEAIDNAFFVLPDDVIFPDVN
ncbi:MAG: hypothetical protein JW731_12180 [Bacteroidales bacterium]|nr:hypothetical protein [Bacteroidales bacterium]